MNVAAELLKDAVRNVHAIWRRSLLAVLGIVIGTTSVVVVVAISVSARQQSIRLFDGTGPNILAIYTSLTGGRVNPGMAISDVVSAPLHLPLVVAATPLALLGQQIIVGNQKLDVSIVGATYDLTTIAKFSISAGRFLSDYDSTGTFAVIGSRLAQQLRTSTSHVELGNTLRLGSYFYTIIGVLDPVIPNPLFPVDFNTSIIIPIAGFQRISSSNITAALMRHASNNGENEIKLKIVDYFKTRNPSVSIEVRSAIQILELMNGQNHVYSILILSVGVISLIICSIVIFTVMQMSVNERRREIGLRLALGARTRDICFTFLTEAMILSLIGSLFGVALGSETSFLFAKLSGWEFYFSSKTPTIAFCSSLATGLCSGLYPALKAARLDPIAALHF